MNWFKKKEIVDYINLSIGRVGIKPLTNGIVNKVAIKSTMQRDIINNALYFTLLQYELLDLSKRQIDGLSIKDADKVKLKIRQILIEHGLIQEVKEVSKEEAEMLDNQFKEVIKKWN